MEGHYNRDQLIPAPRILIVDDHEIVRLGLRALLESRPGWQVVGEADGGRAGLAMVKVVQPDIAVVDLVMPEMNGLELTRQLRQAVPQLSVLIMTMHDVERVVVQDARDVGARGFLLKHATGTELFKAIEAILEGQAYFIEGHQSSSLASVRPGLSPREREVAQLIAEGCTTKEVAAKLNISPRTVESHRVNLMTKLNLTSLADLVRYAIRSRLAHP